MIRKVKDSSECSVSKCENKQRLNRYLGEPMLITLCSTCARPFYDMSDHLIKRADYDQVIKEECCYCGIRQGYDFWIYDKSGRQQAFMSIA